MPPLVIAAIALAAAGASYSIVKGAHQKKKAGKIARENIRPDYNVPTEYQDNQALAESQAGQGLSDASRQAYLTNADRGLSSSVNAILKAGGNPNLVSSAYDQYETDIGKFALADDAARLGHVNQYMAANETLGSLEDKQWQINKFAPYADKAQLAADLAREGSKNIDKGVSDLSQIGFQAAGAMYGKGGKSTSDNASLSGGNVPAVSSYGQRSTVNPSNITVPNSISNYQSPNTTFISGSGYSPQLSGRSAFNMNTLGVRSLDNINNRGAMETGQANPYQIDWNNLYLNNTP